MNLIGVRGWVVKFFILILCALIKYYVWVNGLGW